MNKTFVLREVTHARQCWAFIKANWQAMADEGKPLAVVIAPAKSKRTLDQNARYWGPILDTITANAWVNGKQYSKTCWHAYFAGKFIGEEILPDGRAIPVSTTTLGVEQFSKYMDEVTLYAAQELGISI